MCAEFLNAIYVCSTITSQCIRITRNGRQLHHQIKHQTGGMATCEPIKEGGSDLVSCIQLCKVHQQAKSK